MAAQQNFIAEGHPVPTSHGWTWIADGWRFFRRQPGLWIAMAASLAVIFGGLLFVVRSFFLNALLSSVLFPLFVAGVVIGCHALHEGNQLKFGHLFAGFKHRTLALIGFGLLYFATTMVSEALGGGLGQVLSAARSAGEMERSQALATLLLPKLIALALTLPVVMAVWFAPPLLIFHQMSAFQAARASFYGCLKNVLPFLIYGIIILGFALIPAILFGLSLILGASALTMAPLILLLATCLVLGPVIGASIYTSYRDIYFT